MDKEGKITIKKDWTAMSFICTWRFNYMHSMNAWPSFLFKSNVFSCRLFFILVLFLFWIICSMLMWYRINHKEKGRKKYSRSCNFHKSQSKDLKKLNNSKCLKKNYQENNVVSPTWPPWDFLFASFLERLFTWITNLNYFMQSLCSCWA